MNGRGPLSALTLVDLAGMLVKLAARRGRYLVQISPKALALPRPYLTSSKLIGLVTQRESRPRPTFWAASSVPGGRRIAR